MPSPPSVSPSRTPSVPSPNETFPPPPPCTLGAVSSAPPPNPPRVVEIRLPRLRLSGPISDRLATGLPFLQKLSLRQNSSGPISASLSRLSHLRSLFLWFNSLTGPLLPSLLTNLSGLQVFSTTGNVPTSSVPTALPGSLHFLDLSSNALAGPLPDNLSTTTPCLQLLNLSFNRFLGTLPPSLARLHSLLYLWLDWNHLEGAIPAILANYSSLHLGLQGNDLQGILPAALPIMRSLQVLSLSLSRKPLPLTTSSAVSTVHAHLETPTLAIDHKLIVSRGRQLSGHVHISGSKNVALPRQVPLSLCCATGPAAICGMPNLCDTRTMATVLRSVGARVEKAGGGEVVVDTSGVGSAKPLPDDVGRIRVGVFVLGPLVARFEEAKVALLGGCKIGVRPIDLYVRGLSALGDVVELS